MSLLLRRSARLALSSRALSSYHQPSTPASSSTPAPLAGEYSTLVKDRLAARRVEPLPPSWVDRQPPHRQPWLRVARFDRPVGTHLLLAPGLAGLGLAAIAEPGVGFPLALYGAFGVGAALMRGAGCALNDGLCLPFFRGA